MLQQDQTIPFPGEVAAWLGDLHPLVEQLGSTDGLVTMASVADTLRLRPVDSAGSLREFLRCYHHEVLSPVELPAIRDAYYHAIRNEARELVELDNRIADMDILRDLHSASRRVGQNQLQRFRPFNDVRLVQRYLQAVDAGEAQGWHTLVYGVTLAVYSLPLRQGLVDYSHQVVWGFIAAMTRSLNLSERQARALYDEFSADLMESVASLFPPPRIVE